MNNYINFLNNYFSNNNKIQINMVNEFTMLYMLIKEL